MTAPCALGYVWAASALVMTVAWLHQRRSRNATLVDACWAGLLGLAALFYGLAGSGLVQTRFIAAVLASLWAFRLCLHLLGRALREDEDARYRYLRDRWRNHQGKFFVFYQMQAVAVVLFSVPFAVAAWNPSALALWQWVTAIAIWIVAVGGETIADQQLARWRSRSEDRDRVCREGLWRYTRHPNYFFEWLHWFAYIPLAIGSPWQHWAWLGPVLMWVSLHWISGIPHVEAQALRRRGDDYRRYQQQTSRFFPWPPRS